MKPSKPAVEMSPRELARYIDQSVLKPEFSEAEIRKYIQEGIDYGCITACVNPASIPIALELCEGTDTEVCPVMAFPFGLDSTKMKVLEARYILETWPAIKEIDFVSNYGWARSGKWDEFYNDIKAVVDEIHKHNATTKVIFETDTLDEAQIRKCCELAIKAKADFVKTSTGFLTGFEAEGASERVIAIMLDACKGQAKIKGAACIRTREHFLKLIDMGIDRMGIGFRSTPVVLGLK